MINCKLKRSQWSEEVLAAGHRNIWRCEIAQQATFQQPDQQHLEYDGITLFYERVKPFLAESKLAWQCAAKRVRMTCGREEQAVSRSTFSILSLPS